MHACMHYIISLVCTPPTVTIELEFSEYTMRESTTYHVCAVATGVAFPITAEFHIINGTARGQLLGDTPNFKSPTTPKIMRNPLCSIQ